jgi:hypothetical protein
MIWVRSERLLKEFVRSQSLSQEVLPQQAFGINKISVIWKCSLQVVDSI